MNDILISLDINLLFIFNQLFYLLKHYQAIDLIINYLNIHSDCFYDMETSTSVIFINFRELYNLVQKLSIFKGTSTRYNFFILEMNT